MTPYLGHGRYQVSLESDEKTSGDGSANTTMVQCATLTPASGESGGETLKSGWPVEGSIGQPDAASVLEYVLSGSTTISLISARSGWNPADIKRILDDPQFQLMLLGARRDMSLYVVNWIKKRALTYVKEMHNLAIHADDERVKFQAAKDLLDRAGTGGQTKIALGTPQQYKQLVEELSEPDEKDVT